MNTYRQVEVLRKRVFQTIRDTRGTEPFTADPRALRSYLEAQLDGASRPITGSLPLERIAEEALQLHLVRSLTPHQQRLALHRHASAKRRRSRSAATGATASAGRFPHNPTGSGVP